MKNQWLYQSKTRSTPRTIGKHKDCGGEVLYHSGPSFAYRRCSDCGQDGTNGTFSPALETER